MEHKITIPNAITITRGGVKIATIPATYDFGHCPPIYHLKALTVLQMIPPAFVEAELNFKLDSEGRVITNPDGSPQFEDDPGDPPEDSDPKGGD